MRVLHVSPTFYPAVRYGGPIFSVFQLCVSLADLGCEVRVLTTDANGLDRLTPEQQSDPLLKSLTPEFCRSLSGTMIAPGFLLKLYEAVEQADIIHLTAVYNFTTIPTLIRSRLAGKAVVWSPRGTLQRWHGSRHVLLKSCWEKMCNAIRPRDVVLHVTSETEALESAAVFTDLPTSLIPNGVHIPLEPPLQRPSNTFSILFIGRLDPKKGLENLITAVGKLASLGVTDWSMRIVGDGAPKYTATLRELAAHHIATGSVEFCGHLEGAAKYQAFVGSDVVIVPSYTENFGLVIAEALAHSRPVIASRGTPWSQVEERQCGFWVDNDPESLAIALKRMVDSDRVAMGRRGRDWMMTEFSWRERAGSMLSLYRRLAQV